MLNSSCQVVSAPAVLVSQKSGILDDEEAGPLSPWAAPVLGSCVFPAAEAAPSPRSRVSWCLSPCLSPQKRLDRFCNSAVSPLHPHCGCSSCRLRQISSQVMYRLDWVERCCVHERNYISSCGCCVGGRQTEIQP